MESEDLPIVLLHVCSSWRRAALCIPRLWSELAVRFGDSQGELLSLVIPNKARDVEKWVYYGGRGPRRLRLAFDWSYGTPYDFKIPGACSEDVRHLEVITAELYSPSIIDLLPTESTLAALHTLIVWSESPPRTTRAMDLLPTTSDASQLCRVWIHNYEPFLSLDHGRDMLPWSRLTHLVIESPLSSIRQVVEACPHLLEAAFFVQHPTILLQEREEPFAHKYLKRMTLFLSCVWIDIANLFVDQAYPALESLQISSPETYSEIFDWNGFMTPFPSIKELYMGPRINSHEDFSYNAFNAYNPFLDTLIIDQSLDNEFEIVSALGMRGLLQRRRDSETLAALKRVILLFPFQDEDGQGPEDLIAELQEELKEFTDSGLSLEIIVGSTPYRSMFSAASLFLPWSGTTWKKFRRDYSVYRSFA